MLIPEWQRPGMLAALWPLRPDVWRQNAQPAQQALLRLLLAAEAYVPILVGAPKAQVAALRRELPKSFEVIALPYNDAWLCDFAPFWSTADGTEVVAVHWQLDAWAGLYADTLEDNRCAAALAAYFGIQSQPQTLVFEGGNLTADGAGHALAVAGAVKRSGFEVATADSQLKAQLQLAHISWIEAGMSSDETQAHIDNMALFIDANTLVVTAIPNPSHPDFQMLTSFHQRLEQLRNRQGQPYRIIQLPTPEPLLIADAELASVRVTAGVKDRSKPEPILASYVNLVIIGGKALLVPQFQIDEDPVALARLREALPGWEVIGVDAREFVLAGGGLHCMTHVIPADVLASARPESI